MEKSYLIGENGLYWRKNVLHRKRIGAII